MFEEMRLYIDYAQCIGCETCEATCRFLYTYPRIHMVRTQEGIMAPLYCQHCASPKCAAACERGAFSQDADGAVVLDPLKCVGCRAKECVTACPYGAIFISGACLRADLSMRRHFLRASRGRLQAQEQGGHGCPAPRAEACQSLRPQMRLLIKVHQGLPSRGAFWLFTIG